MTFVYICEIIHVYFGLESKMNIITVSGGNVAEKRMVENIGSWCIKKLLPRYRTINLHFKLKKLPHGEYGYCQPIDEKCKSFVVIVQRGLKLFDIITTVTHEMVHVKQFVRKELEEECGRQKWKKKFISESTEYRQLPWEKEAFKLQDELAIECLKDIYSDEY